jgi:hypothetical protein
LETFFLKEADIGFGELSIYNERSAVANFLYPHIITSASFITSIPKSEPIITLFVKPFDYLVWISLMLVFILIFLNEWIQSLHYFKLKNIDIYWNVISMSLNQQISCRLPSINSFRIMLSSWMIAVLVLTSSYAGCLYSLMAFPSQVKTIDTITELALAQKNGQIQVITTDSYRSFQVLFQKKNYSIDLQKNF